MFGLDQIRDGDGQRGQETRLLVLLFQISRVGLRTNGAQNGSGCLCCADRKEIHYSKTNKKTQCC